MELEDSLPDFIIQPRIKAPKPRTVTKSGFVRRKYRQERQLAEIHAVNPYCTFEFRRNIFFFVIIYN